MTVNLSAKKLNRINNLFNDESDAKQFIQGTLQQIDDLGVEKALSLFSSQAGFAACQLRIAIDIAQNEGAMPALHGLNALADEGGDDDV